MATSKKVQLGPNAYSFNDQATGISISRGEVKELTPRQLATTRIKRALAQGHLSLVLEEKQAKKYTEEEIDKLINKLKAQHKKGMEISKVAKGYSDEEVQLIAKQLGFDVEKDDTTESLLTAIFEEFDGDK